ncbi:MFS transporter [Corynebacterium sp. MSK044]|uniref:MFS transporter n=1 Tax=Corynebacterium sp. MSK044 TaxID=3050195 RepID=UPI00254A6C8E|nr:MFS transporter [Corynebacterium sp. MSK044]MDK8797693.1 MFS transporter [Corynebacterium sp. MSK044]
MATSPSARSGAPAAENRSLTIMFAAALAAFIATFNETFLNVGFNRIMADFNIGVSAVQWLATAYMLGAAVMTPTAGFFIRRFSTKPLYLAMTTLGPSIAILASGMILEFAS